MKATLHRHSQQCIVTTNNNNLSDDNQHNMSRNRWHSMEDTTSSIIKNSINKKKLNNIEEYKNHQQ